MASSFPQPKHVILECAGVSIATGYPDLQPPDKGFLYHGSQNPRISKFFQDGTVKTESTIGGDRIQMYLDEMKRRISSRKTSVRLRSGAFEHWRESMPGEEHYTHFRRRIDGDGDYSEEECLVDFNKRKNWLQRQGMLKNDFYQPQQF